MRLVTWNVNSLRARLPRVLTLLHEFAPDVVCLQETKCAAAQVPRPALEQAGYQVVDHSSGRWNGVAILVNERNLTQDVVCGLAGEPMAGESRWVEATVNGVRVTSVYVPNGARSLDEKITFLEAAASRAHALASHGPLVIAGDLNVAITDCDVAAPFAGAPTHVTPRERAALDSITEVGLVDAFRQLHPLEQGFTWWDYRLGAFRRGIGMRLDYVLASEDLDVDRCEVLLAHRCETEAGKPSDHAPVVAELA